MKILSLWQPWASCIAHGLKLNETRSWSTEHRGPLWIHAAKGGLRGRDRAKMMQDSWWQRVMALLHYPTIEDLPRGVVLCCVDLKRMTPTNQLETMDLSPLEKFLGDYSPHRFAWQFENIVRVAPVPVVGRQSIFTPSPDEKRQIQLALRDAT